MKKPNRETERWPPRLASRVVNALLPCSTRYYDYREYLTSYRRLVSETSTSRAENFARWRACDDAWRAVPDYVKHGLFAFVIKMLPGGN